MTVEFFDIQTGGFLQNQVGDGDLAEVVQHGGNAQQVLVDSDLLLRAGPD